MSSLALAWNLYFPDGGWLAGWSDSDNNATQPGWGFGLAELGNKWACLHQVILIPSKLIKLMLLCCC